MIFTPNNFYKNTSIRSNILLTTILIILSLFSLTIGVKDFSLAGFLKGNQSDVFIGIISRIPRLISILITGASLSLSGLIIQAITNNKFSSPTTMGIMNWAKLGILISIIFFGSKSIIFKMIIAFIFTLIGTNVFTILLKIIKINNIIVVPLIGIMIGSVVNSITVFFAYQLDLIQNINTWLQGSFSLIIKGNYEMIFVGLPFLIIAYFYADKFTIVGMSEKIALSLGVNYKIVVMTGLMIISVITSSVVVSVGSIPFVGLVIPNIVSLYKGDNLKKSLYSTMILGSMFVLICDLIGRIVLYPYEIPVSIIINIIGSIIFIILIKNKYSS